MGLARGCDQKHQVLGDVSRSLLPACSYYRTVWNPFHGGRSFILTPRSATEAAQAARIDEPLL